MKLTQIALSIALFAGIAFGQGLNDPKVQYYHVDRQACMNWAPAQCNQGVVVIIAPATDITVSIYCIKMGYTDKDGNWQAAIQYVERDLRNGYSTVVYFSLEDIKIRQITVTSHRQVGLWGEVNK